MLPLLLELPLLLPANTSRKTQVVEQRSFEVSNASCTLKALNTVASNEAPSLKVIVLCDGMAVASKNFGFASLGNVEIYGSRVFISFERGVMSCLTVLNVNSNQSGSSGQVVFERCSKNGAEYFEDGDVILAHVRRRFVDTGILPGGTNVYRWKDGKYEFDGSFLWIANASWKDRYCILFGPEKCPAEQGQKRIPDEYEN